MKNLRAGWTLMELVIVIAVIGILSAIALPKIAATRDDAMARVELKRISDMVSEIQQYYNLTGNINIIPTSDLYPDSSGKTNARIAYDMGDSEALLEGGVNASYDPDRRYSGSGRGYTAGFLSHPLLRKDHENINGRFEVGEGYFCALVSLGKVNTDHSNADIMIFYEPAKHHKTGKDQWMFQNGVDPACDILRSLLREAYPVNFTDVGGSDYTVQAKGHYIPLTPQMYKEQINLRYNE